MMKFATQVCTVGQAKKLNELGIYQDAEFFWVYYTTHTTVFLDTKKRANALVAHTIQKFGDQSDAEIVAGFSCSELGEMLPENCVSFKRGDRWICKERETAESVEIVKLFEAHARGAMLIHLLETGAITPQTVNNHITNKDFFQKQNDHDGI